MDIFGIPTFANVIDKFTNEMKMIRNKQEADKKRLAEEWVATKNMPRKLKKRRRKEILVDWAIADHKLFGELSDEELDACASTLKAFVSH